VIEVNTDGEVYTRHGLRKNQKGKEQTAEKITNEVKDICCRKKIKPINLQWKEDVDGAELRVEDGVSKGRLPKDSQTDSKPHEQGAWNIKTSGQN